MISFSEAQEQVLSRICPLGPERVPLLQALGRVIAEDIRSERDLPGFDHSAMDGYAVRHADVLSASDQAGIRLEVVEELPAGSVAKRRIEKGQAARIMTGAPVPEGADGVVPVERTDNGRDSVTVFEAISPGQNIRRAGEEIAKGECVFSAGDPVRPVAIGTLASLGYASVSVYQRPRVAILCTGNELVDVTCDPKGAEVVASNGYALTAQVEECGAIPVQLGIAKDRKEEIQEKLRHGSRADVILSSAGVSAGDYDFVKEVLREMGTEMVFSKVAMKPGQSVAFGMMGQKPVFGLPGNPVSSLVCFEQFVRPSLLKMMGYRRLFRPVIEAVLREDLSKEAGKRHFIRSFVFAEGGQYVVTTVWGKDQKMPRPTAQTNGLIIIPEERGIVRIGESVQVQLLDRDL